MLIYVDFTHGLNTQILSHKYSNKQFKYKWLLHTSKQNNLLTVLLINAEVYDWLSINLLNNVSSGKLLM